MGSMLSKCYGDDAQPDARPPPPPAAAADGHSPQPRARRPLERGVGPRHRAAARPPRSPSTARASAAGKSCTAPGVEAVGAARRGALPDAWVENAAAAGPASPSRARATTSTGISRSQPAAGAAAAARFVLRLGDATERIALAAGAAPRHDGILKAVRRGARRRAPSASRSSSCTTTRATSSCLALGRRGRRRGALSTCRRDRDHARVPVARRSL